MEEQRDSDLELNIAVIGMQGRFPGAANIDEFWYNLCHSVESISQFSNDEREFSHIQSLASEPRKRVNAGGVLDDIEMFDADFFGYSPREAELIDPQQRVLLECAHEALELAGYGPSTYPGPCGVFVGGSLSTYLLENLIINPDLVEAVGIHQIKHANDASCLATRISYKLGLTGPSFHIQTACSTSLVAVHLACQSLLDHQCDMAIAGGVSISVPQKSGYAYAEAGFLSPDGHCRAFDAGAQGTVVGNGVGIVVLKRFDDAIADGDTVLAVLRGSAINNDGSNKIGFTAPSVSGQADVIATALAVSGVEAESISYVEAHGTGTILGDPIEIAALTNAFNLGHKHGGCALGSLKTNIGHLDAAAGVAGLIKVVLALKNKKIPASLNFQQPNSQIDFQQTPFFVNTDLVDWDNARSPRRAGISAFGIGGTNAHVIAEESLAPTLPPSSSQAWQIIPISGKSHSALEGIASSFCSSSVALSSHDLADIAFTLQRGRMAMPYRRAVVGDSLSTITDALTRMDAQSVASGLIIGESIPVTFMFPGTGDQYPALGAELYRSEPVFRDSIDACAEILKPHLQMDFRDILYPGISEAAPDFPASLDANAANNHSTIDLRQMLRRSMERTDQQLSPMDRPLMAHTIVFAVEYAMANLWISWGVRPSALLGYSLGEYTAACLAGVFSLEDALMLVANRARLIETLPEGGMVAVSSSEDEIHPWLDDDVSLSAISGPSLCVLSGSKSALEGLSIRLDNAGIIHQRIATSHSLHSEAMRPLEERFLRLFDGVELYPPSIPYLSNVTGTWITADLAIDPQYWLKHLCGGVLLSSDFQEALRRPNSVLLEIGPGQALTTAAISHQSEDCPVRAVSTMPSSYEKQSGMKCCLFALAKLWVFGVDVDWKQFHRKERRKRVPCPTYAWQKERCWIEPPSVKTKESPSVSLIKRNEAIDDWFYMPVWKRAVLPASSPSQAAPLARRHWLLFMDRGNLGNALVKLLQEMEDEVDIVSCAGHYDRISEHRFQINPSNGADYDRLFSDLMSSRRVPRRIINLWSLDTTETDGASGPEAAYSGLFEGLLSLIQSSSKLQNSEALRFSMIGSGLCKVESADIIYPDKTTILALSALVPQEFSQIVYQTIDLGANVSDVRALISTFKNVILECLSDEPPPVVAYRSAHRYIRAFEPLPSSTHRSSHLRPSGVYLITGGLGRIGLTLAKYLAAETQGKLVLTSTSGLPPRDEWPGYLSRPAHDKVRGRIEQVLGLEKTGATVMVMKADAGDREQMQAVFTAINKTYGALNGVIHAAGVVGPLAHASLAETDRAQCQRHFLPKIYGLYILRDLLAAKHLDFVILTSSLSPILGGLGFAAYAAANLFMDSFAEAMTGNDDAPWMSVNWEGWRFPDTAIPGTEIGASILNLALSPSEGEEVFKRILPRLGREARIIISTADLPLRYSRWVESVASKKSEIRSDEIFSTSIRRPQLTNPYTAPTTEVERALASLWSRLLGIQDIGTMDSFFYLGGHSLLGIQLLSHVRSMFSVNVQLGRFLETPTIRELAFLVEEAMIADLELMTDAEAAKWSASLIDKAPLY